MGLLVSWIQKAGRGTNKLASDKKKERLLSIFANHCSFVTGQRLRRALQIGELYSNLYSERTRWTLVGNIWRRLQSKHAPTGKLIAALAGVFMWEDEKIGDDELRRYFPHFWTVYMVLFVILEIRTPLLSDIKRLKLALAVQVRFLLLTNLKHSSCQCQSLFTFRSYDKHPHIRPTTAEFSFTLIQTQLSMLISVFKKLTGWWVWSGLELNSAADWPSREWFEEPCLMTSVWHLEGVIWWEERRN